MCVYAGSSTEFETAGYLLGTCESTVEIETEADSNDITETADPLHDKPSDGMFGFDDAIFSTHICSCVVWFEFVIADFLYTDIGDHTVIDECKHSQLAKYTCFTVSHLTE